LNLSVVFLVIIYYIGEHYDWSCIEYGDWLA